MGNCASPAELEDLWAIDNAAYSKASITCDYLREISGLVVVLPARLRSLFSRTALWEPLAL